MSAGKSSDALCCCEYINQDGERSHILACLCECDAIDQAADKCIRCQPIPAEVTDRLCSTVHDRFRLPWFSNRGALRLRFDVIFPILAVPCLIHLGSLHPLMTFIVTLSSPVFLLCVYRCWSRSNTTFRRTNLFFSWAVFSVIFCYISLLVGLLTLRKVLLWELMTLSSLFLLLLYTLVLVKTNKSVVPRGYLRRSNIDRTSLLLPLRPGKFHRKSRSLTGLDFEPAGGNGPKAAEGREMMRDFAWCKICELEVPPRSGHCPVCNVCVAGRDHHCVWINECIGATNRRAFFFGLTIFIVTGIYGIHLSLTSVCTPAMYLDWLLLPNDCRFVYEDPLFSWMFSGAAYAGFAVGMMCLIWIHQFILISKNMTGLEVHRTQSSQKTSLFCFSPRHRYNRGFLRNWIGFLFDSRSYRFLFYHESPCTV